MKNETSKDMMKRTFDTLATMQPLEPPAHLYGIIMSEINDKNHSAASKNSDEVFEKLHHIPQLTPPSNLYNNILSKVSSSNMTISKKYISAAAAVFAVVLCLEVFMLMKSSESNTMNEIEVLVQEENNQLYE